MIPYVESDLQAVADKAVQIFFEQYELAVEDRGQMIVGLSGGSTPKALYHALRKHPLIQWENIWFTFTDERFVPVNHPESNEGLAREHLFRPLHISDRKIISLIRANDPYESADEAESVLQRLFGSEPLLDLALLGLGDDGHTASLFPGEPGVHVHDRDIIVTRAPVNAPIRISMTPRILNRARRTVFMVSGASKRKALWRCLRGPANFDETPSQAVARYAWRPEVIADVAAAEDVTWDNFP